MLSDSIAISGVGLLVLALIALIIFLVVRRR
jgi:hypothetical protein